MAIAMRQPRHRPLVETPDATRRVETRLVPRPHGSRALVVPASAAAAKGERTVIGILALLASVGLFAVSDTASKVLTASMPAIEVAWLRYLVFTVMTVPLLLRGKGVLATSRPAVQVGRAVASACSTSLFVVAFGLMPVANATAIGFMAPIVVTGMAALLLAEKVGIRRWSAAVVGLVGVMVIVQPGGSSFGWTSLVPLAGSVMSASAVIGARLAKDERPETTMLYGALVGFAVVTAFAAVRWQVPSWSQIAVGGLSGFFATVATLMQLFAYRYAPASMLAPFSYTQLLWAGGLGFLVFGTVPGVSMVAGAAIIAASGVYTAWREAVRGREARAAG